MKNKYLDFIQTLMKVGKVITRIINVFTIIGAIFSITGLVMLLVVKDDILIGEITIKGIIENSSGLTEGTIYTSLIIAIITCLGESVSSEILNRYFKQELKEGTPFTVDQSKKLLKMGAIYAIISFTIAVLTNAAYTICSTFFTDVENMNIDMNASIGFGLFLMVLSVFTRYTATELEKKNDNQDEGKTKENE